MSHDAGVDPKLDEVEDDEPDQTPDRKKNLATTKKVREKLLKLYEDVEKGFTDQNVRSDDTKDYWDLYNCELGPRQFYSGNAQIFVPIVHNAIGARVTRFTNQLFPQSGRHVECISSDPQLPQATLALAEHYVSKAHLRELVPALLTNGDVEGHYHVYASWATHTRYVTKRVSKPVETGDGPSSEKVDDIEDEVLKASHPEVEILADSDVLVLPATSDSLAGALEAGGSVTILRRWGKAKLQQMIDDGHIDRKEGEELIEEMSKDFRAQKTDKPKDMASAAGIKKDGRGKWSLIFETWSLVSTPDGKRLCRTFFGGPKKILSCHRNPLWCDRLPLISAPVEKIQGSFKGQSQIKPVADLQYYANDIMNEAADSSSYAMLPIIMTDPEKNPKVGSMVLSLAAVWETSPRDTQFAQFPPLWKDGLEIVAQVKQEIMQTLNVNPAMITQAVHAKKKQTQAEVAQEQQVDILTTSDAVQVVEEGILTPLISLFIEMDHQYRDEEILVRQYGEMGMAAGMEAIPPIQMDHRYAFRWFGVESARNAQQIQQQIAALNVVRGIPPQLYMGYTLNMAPAITNLIESAFGPQLGRLVFRDMRSELSMDPDKENQMMDEGHIVPVHPLDDHQMHMQVHVQAMQELGDAHGVFREHLLLHQQAAVQQAQAQGQAAQGSPGAPGGAGPGQPGQSPGGAQTQGPRGQQGPPGMIHPDDMSGTQQPRPRGMLS